MVGNGKTGDVMQLGARGEEGWKGPREGRILRQRCGPWHASALGRTQDCRGRTTSSYCGKGYWVTELL